MRTPSAILARNIQDRESKAMTGQQDLEKQLELNHPIRGKLEQEYQIYVDNAESLGLPVLDFEDWLEG